MRTRFKICCIATPEEARLAIDHGAHAIGLVSEMPSGPGVIDADRIHEIAAGIPPGVASFLLTSRVRAEAVIEQHGRARTSALQFVDRMEVRELIEIRKALPGVSLVQVVHVQGDDAVRESLEKAQFVDTLLLDSGRPDAAEKQLGGTGRTHDWLVSARIVREVRVPVFLAGGLTPTNVREAIDIVQPFAVDVCSGLRSDDGLDEVRLREFAARVTE